MSLAFEPEETAPIRTDRPLLLGVGAIVPDALTAQLEVNATCVLIDINGKAAYSVYAHDLRSPDGAVAYTGYRPQNTGPNQGEGFRLNLNALSTEIAVAYVTVSSHEVERFGDVQDVFLDMHYDGEELAEHIGRYQLAALKGSRGMLLARFVRNGPDWHAQTLRFGFYINSETELAGKAAEHWGWYPPHTI